MSAEIYQVWESDDGGDCVERTLSTREGCADLARRGLMGPEPRLVDEFVACSLKDAVAFHRRIERSRRSREGDD